MKQIIGAMALLLCISANSFAQKKTLSSDTIHVDGICEQCQKRIENAAYIKGVKHRTTFAFHILY